jgi:hypothetical protein
MEMRHVSLFSFLGLHLARGKGNKRALEEFSRRFGLSLRREIYETDSQYTT